MGPRLERRGRMVSTLSNPDANKLQWGRGWNAAGGTAPADDQIAQVTASMGPRLERRGRPLPD